MKRKGKCWPCGKGNVCVHEVAIARPAGIPALPRELTVKGAAEEVVLPMRPWAWLPVGWAGEQKGFTAGLGIARGDASDWIAFGKNPALLPDQERAA